MIDYGAFHFAAPPLTGADWFVAACRAVGLGDGRGDPYEPFDDGGADVFRVSLVRHPCHWLGEAYATGEPALTELTGHLTFDGFVREYLERAPGAMGRLFNRYHFEKAHSVLKIEDMPWAFISLAETLGLKHPHRAKFPPLPSVLNGSPEWDRSLWRRVMEAEKEIGERYDYY